MPYIIRALFLIALCIGSNAYGATKYTISGKIAGANKPNSALLIAKTGVTRTTVNNGKFSLKNLSAATLKNARLYFFKDGRPVGPAVLKQVSGSKYVTFSGTAPSGTKTLSINFSTKKGYLLSKTTIDSKWIGKSKVKNSKFAGASLGYPGAGTSSLHTAGLVTKDASTDPSVDSESDGVPDVLDIDDDNDGIPDDRDTGGGSMISTTYLSFSNSINAHIGNLNDTTISNLFSAENVFALTFFIGLNESLSTGTGGHVVCNASQVICRSAADGGTTSFYSGVSESNPSVQNQTWSDFNSDGSGKPNLEVLSIGGGTDKVLVAAIQPRSSSFSAGEILTANITSGTRVIGTKIFSILPPVISSPALVSYNAGGGEVTVDYTDSNTPGSSGSNPIVLTGNSLTLNFYPPQRKAIEGVEADGQYRDIGSSRLGVILGGSGISQEFTCAGYYSGLSSGLTEIASSSSMPAGNIFSQTGAVAWPINDSTPDTIHTSGALKTLTVDLAGCLNRAGVAPGSYIATLIYAGSDTNFGAPRSGQNIFVTIPAVS